MMVSNPTNIHAKNVRDALKSMYPGISVKHGTGTGATWLDISHPNGITRQQETGIMDIAVKASGRSDWRDPKILVYNNPKSKSRKK